MKKSRDQKEKQSFGERLLFFFFPPKCALCGRVGWEELCPECEERVREDFDPKRFLAAGGNGFADEMLRLFPYRSEAIKPLLFSWKRDEYEDLRRIFSRYIRLAIKKKLLPAKVDLVTFAPRRPSARLQAGFDQAESLARTVAEELGLPFETLLSRRGFSLAQHKLKGERREKNVKGAFAATRPLEGETILLIDDIVTTGASVKECARILKKSGAMKVFVLCIAH